MPEVPANAHRNFAQTSTRDWSNPYTSFNGGSNKCPNLGKVLTDGMQVGDEFKARIVLKYDNIVPAEGKTAKVWMQGSGNVTNWGAGGFPNTAGQKVLNGSGEIVFESAETLKAEHLKNDWWNWAFRLDYVASGSVQWKEGKVEIGKSFTPYTPAPEQLGWSTDTLVPTKSQRYLWKFEYIYYSDGSVEIAGPVNLSIAGQDADATEAINKTKQELLEKLETVRDDSLEAVNEAKQQLVTVRNESLAAAEEAKQGLINVNTKVDNAKAELTQAKQQLTTVSDDLSKAKTDFQNAVSAVDTKATNLKSDLAQAKQDLASQAQQLQAQANAQSELTKRVSSVEKTANGTKTTVGELSKTVAQNGKDITSVTARTKVVEDDLSGTKTTLSQVQTTANSTSQKTATLETGLNGLSAKFNSLSVGNKNYLPASRVVNRGCSNFSYSNTTKSWTMTAPASSSGYGNGIKFNTNGLNILLNGGETLFFGLMIKANKACSFNYDVNNALSGTTSNDNDDTSKRAHSPSNKSIPANAWTKVWFSYTAKANVAITENNSNFGIVNNTEPVTIEIKEVMVAKSNVPVDYQAPDADLEQKVAEYKQNADQNYASLQTTVQNLDGTVQHNKTVAEQTAEGFKTRIESLETYKSGESTRANQYFELAKTETARQLSVERTAIAKDYVAKSTYTSDVTGIRNDLTATTTTANTTKTNLANYQASNDRAVANLQSNIQTANGDISSLKTKVEAVPGQITSAVSAVEGKIPTEIGAVNLLKNSKSFTGSNIGGSGTILSETYQGCAVRHLKVTGEVAVAEFKNCVYPKLGGEYVASFWAKGNGKFRVYFYGNSGYLGVASGSTSEGNTVTRGDGLFDFNLTANWKRYWVKYKLKSDPSSATNVGKHLLFRTTPNGSENEVYLAGAKLEEGNVVSGYTPAPEDTAEQISSLSSELKQTKDGISLLATKTELNTAKSELQSGINTATNKANSAQSTANNNAQTISTHTTQISALNTGLSAKVSQSDFNTLSGRVTTAENNITAKANELSSKISSVEGKIPTEIGGRNLYALSKNSPLGSNNIGDFKQNVKTGEISFKTTGQDPYFGSQAMKNEAVGTSRGVKIPVKAGQSVAVWLTNPLFTKNHVSYFGDDDRAVKNYKGYPTNKFVIPASELAGVSYVTFRFGIKEETQPVGSAHSTKVKVEYGNVYSDWSPAPEDTIEQISAVSSELKQTKDGITLLATKTELNSAKTDLQSGITTATNKANSAQNTANSAQNTANSAQNKANSNAQTISTHTTQISALNTGLQAKVSQSDFNTLSGRVTTAENNITAKANELSSKITSVEGKIPTEIGTVNLLKNTKSFTGSNITGSSTLLNETYQGCAVRYLKSNNSASGYQEVAQFNSCVYPKLGGEYVASFWAKGSGTFTAYFYGNSGYLQVASIESSQGNSGTATDGYIKFTLSTNWQRYWIKYKLKTEPASATSVDKHFLIRHLSNGKVEEIWLAGCKLEEGNVVSGYEPAPEDTATQISSLSSELKQTKDGITLLATKTELNTAKNELQSGINTATNKANAAQNTANNAQSTANSNAQTISTHTTQISALNTGLSAKVSQTDFNTLSGRVTTAENNITAKANELSSKITSVEGKIPSGEMNLVEYGRPVNGYNRYAGAEYTTHPYYYNGAFKMYIIKNSTTSEKMLGMNRFKVERNTEYTLYFKGFNSSNITNMDVWFLKRVSGSTKDWDSAQMLVGGRKLSYGSAENVSVTFNTGNYDEGYLRFDNNGTTTAGQQADLYFGDVSVKKGKSNNGWSPSLAELASSQDLKNAQSEFKQTTDSIKASVTSLDKSTVKSSSLTINSDGIVMKAGKSTTDVANAIGSYFAVNQNAIDLFADKIKVKGNMIVDGAITGDKIKASSVDVSKIVGIDANFIKSKIEYAMIDWLKGKTITAYNDNMTIDLQDGRISFKDGSNAVYRQTPDGIHTGFLHFEAGSLGGIYAAFGATSTRQGINSKSSEFAGIRCYRVSANGDSHDAKIDKIEVIGDTVQFGHGYRSDGSIGGGFIMDTAAYANETPYSFNRVIKSIESLWRILHDHAKNTGYRFNDAAFINALNNEYNAWHDMHND